MSLRIATAFLLILFAFSPLVYAEGGITVGFPERAIWLSKNRITAGETIKIYVSLYNADSEPFNGTVVFLINTNRVAEKEFTLKPGESALESALWRAEGEGAHTASAIIENVSGIPIASITESSGPIAFAVTKPPTSPVAEGISSVASSLGAIAENIAPAVVSVVQTAHQTIEPYREKAVTYLEEAQKKQREKASAAAAASAEASPPENVSGFEKAEKVDYAKKAAGAWSTLSQAALAGLLFTAKTPAIFYAILLAVLVGALYSLFRWAMRRPF